MCQMNFVFETCLVPCSSSPWNVYLDEKVEWRIETFCFFISEFMNKMK